MMGFHVATRRVETEPLQSCIFTQRVRAAGLHEALRCSWIATRGIRLSYAVVWV